MKASSLPLSSIQFHLAKTKQPPYPEQEFINRSCWAIKGTQGLLLMYLGRDRGEGQGADRKLFIQQFLGVGGGGGGYWKRLLIVTPLLFNVVANLRRAGQNDFWLRLVCVSCVADRSSALYLAH